jgi:hypothetical protein
MNSKHKLSSICVPLIRVGVIDPPFTGKIIRDSKELIGGKGRHLLQRLLSER